VAQYIVKVLLTVLIVVAVTEIAKRSTLWGAVLASLPLTSVLALAWLYLDTTDTARVSELSYGIFWLVLPSLLLFLLLPALLRIGWGFWSSLATACAATVGAYFAMLWLLARLGVRT
jgi:hypothetical protein